MARKKKRPPLTHCKLTKTANARAPWRLWFTAERDGKQVLYALAKSVQGKRRGRAIDLGCCLISFD